MIKELVYQSIIPEYVDNLRKILPDGDVGGGLGLLVPQLGLGAALHQDLGQLPPSHRGCDVQSRVSIL